MTVLVVAESLPESVGTALEGVDWVRVDSGPAAISAVEDDVAADVLVVEATDIDRLIEAVRAMESLVPLVAIDVADPSGLRTVDTALEGAVDADRLRQVVERSLRLRDYDGAVARLYDRARRQASDADGPATGSPELRRLRREADDALSELVALEDPDLLAALIDEPGAGEDDDA